MGEALGDPSQNEGSAEDILEQAGQNKLSDVIGTWWYFTKGSNHEIHEQLMHGLTCCWKLSWA